MPTRVFVGDDEQYFPSLSRWVAPGDEADDFPADDPRFVTKTQARKAKSDNNEEQA